MPVSSRNDPANGITNRVDIYVNGDRPIEVTENLVFSQSAKTFNVIDGITVENINSTTPSMNHELFQRLDGTTPAVGNLFIPLSFSPIDGPATGLQSNGSVVVTAPKTPSPTPAYPTNHAYTYGTDYWIVNEVDQFGRSSKSRAGLEWNATPTTADHMPQTGDVVTVDYTYNQVPTTVQHNMDLWNVVTSDVMVHQANTLYLDFYFAVVLGGNSNAGTVFSSIQTVVSNYLSQVGFDGVVQRSSLISAVQQVNPVTGNVVEVYSATDGSVYRATDIYLDDTELATLNNVYIAQMSQSMFGSV